MFVFCGLFLLLLLQPFTGSLLGFISGACARCSLHLRISKCLPYGHPSALALPFPLPLQVHAVHRCEPPVLDHAAMLGLGLRHIVDFVVRHLEDERVSSGGGCFCLLVSWLLIMGCGTSWTSWCGTLMMSG